MTIKESVLDILIYLFEHYMLENPDTEPDEETIMGELIQAGFKHTTIDSAFDWLENLAIMCDAHDGNSDELIGKLSMRHYHPDELDKLSLETRNLLLSLEHSGVLSPVARELVIDRLMALDVEDIDLHHVKWVILMVLTNCINTDSGISDLSEVLLTDDLQYSTH